MALPKHETFNAADQFLSTYDSNWVDQSPALDKLSIVSNQCKPGTSGGDVFSYWAGDSFTADQCCQLLISGTANFCALGVRLAGLSGSGTSQGYVWYPSLGNVYKLNSTGVLISIASGFTAGVSGDIAKMVIAGSVISCYLNGTLAGSITDTSYASGGSPGLGGSGGGGGALMDEFYANIGSDPTGAGSGLDWLPQSAVIQGPTTAFVPAGLIPPDTPV